MATILCIEDEAELRDIITEVLEEAGYDVCVANDGEKGIEMILEHKPDLVVSDITMPAMDGRELFMELRENHPSFADLPFIFLSALADQKDICEGLKLGVDDYLTKPLNFEMLLATVQSNLRQME